MIVGPTHGVSLHGAQREDAQRITKALKFSASRIKPLKLSELQEGS